MLDALLTLLRDVPASLAVLLGTGTLTSALLLVGATAFAAAALSLLSRGARAVVLATAPARAARRVAEALDLRPVVTQNDPDAPGRARPRAPGLLLG
ncbi:DUF6412 domain-containing protein [Cellulomonas sp.]|uniref:DUF6412 domain-containing protein n=1 Tax=Cellulomonas sp. TaxID=40001 RepID=UPI002D4B87B5|nr:DUF6412 domain-containing protein [Cellulomonas sp.]HYQ74891.1 DUF6412 domain-containing protein [Cellulomonas sp.]